MAWHQVARTEEIAVGEMAKFDVGPLEVAVAHLDDGFYAFGDRCPHMNSPLHLGTLEGDVVTCPMHKTRFNVRTGKKQSDPRIPIPRALKIGSMMTNIRTGDLVTHPVKVEDGAIYVDV